MRQKVSIIDPLGAHGSSHHYYLFGQSSGLINAGVEVNLYTNEITSNPEIKGLNFHQFYNKIYSNDNRILRAFRYIIGSVRSIFHAKISGSKICHFHIFHPNLLNIVDFLLVKILSMKLVYTIHDVISFDDKMSNKKLNKWLFKRADKLLTHNSFSRKILLENYYLTDVEIVPHGNYIPFVKLNVDKSDSRKKIGIDESKKVLLFFGMIKKNKGLDVLLKSLKEVVKNNQDLVLVVAGRAWKDDFSYYQKIINDNKLSDYCIIHNYFISHEDVKFYYSAADLVVLPYTRIYQSGVLLMSMSYNKPVLVSDLEPLIEVIIDNDTGYVFKNGSPSSLSSKIDHIFQNFEDLTRINDKGREFIINHYDWKIIGHKTSEVYKNLL